MRNDSIETLLLRHYGSSTPAPLDLEERLGAMVRQETASAQARQQIVENWQQRRVSRRRLLQLVTLSGAGVSVLALGLSAFQDNQKPAYSV
jgi:homoserine kinase